MKIQLSDLITHLDEYHPEYQQHILGDSIISLVDGVDEVAELIILGDGDAVALQFSPDTLPEEAAQLAVFLSQRFESQLWLPAVPDGLEVEADNEPDLSTH